MVVVRFIDSESGEVYWQCEWLGLLLVRVVRFIDSVSGEVYCQ